MTSLIKYDSARFALQQAVEIDEVKDIRDKAQAMAAYARQANDTQLVEWATEIKVRAERKAGQMLSDMPKNPGQLKNSSRSHDATTTTLSDLGINKTQSSRWQKLAAVPEDQFEQAIQAAKEVAGEVTTAAMLRIEKANRPVPVEPIRSITPTKPEQELEQESEEPEFSESELMAEMAGEINLSDELENAHKEIDRLNKIIESDDQLATAMAENKRLTELCRVIEERARGYQSSENAAVRKAKMWKEKFEKLERQVKAAGLVEF